MPLRWFGASFVHHALTRFVFFIFTMIMGLLYLRITSQTSVRPRIYRKRLLVALRPDNESILTGWNGASLCLCKHLHFIDWLFAVHGQFQQRRAIASCESGYSSRVGDRDHRASDIPNCSGHSGWEQTSDWSNSS